MGDGYSCPMHNSAVSQYVNLAVLTSRFIIWPLGVTTALTAVDNRPFKGGGTFVRRVVSDSVWRLLEQWLENSKLMGPKTVACWSQIRNCDEKKNGGGVGVGALFLREIEQPVQQRFPICQNRSL